VAKVLAQAGVSLADVYNVVGSVAGVDELVSREVHLTHEMGQTIFSERLSATAEVIATSGLAQNISFDIRFSLGATIPRRLLALQVFADVTTRIATAQVSVNSGALAGTDVPIWSWQVGAGSDFERLIRQEVATSTTNRFQLVSTEPPQIPNFLMGTLQPNSVPDLMLRGVTSGFGAGTVVLSAVFYLAFADVRGLSSEGLPMPSW